MHTHNRLRQLAIGGSFAAVSAAAVVALRSAVGGGTAGRRRLRRAGDRAARAVRYRAGRWQGVSYRLKGRRPDPDVSDLVLADRIRSTLGPLERRLDLPHVHVMVEDHTVLLHGEVDSHRHLDQIEKAVAQVAGVVGVESYLHVGLGRGDTRPSQGRQIPVPSAARRQLLAAAEAAGVGASRASLAVRAVLGSLAERIPRDELEQVRAHLPADVQSLLQPPRRSGEPFRRMRSVPEFVAAVVSADGVAPASASALIAAVLVAFKALVPEEVSDIGAVLPAELRHLWETPQP